MPRTKLEIRSRDIFWGGLLIGGGYLAYKWMQGREESSGSVLLSMPSIPNIIKEIHTEKTITVPAFVKGEDDSKKDISTKVSELTPEEQWITGTGDYLQPPTLSSISREIQGKPPLSEKEMAGRRATYECLVEGLNRSLFGQMQQTGYINKTKSYTPIFPDVKVSTPKSTSKVKPPALGGKGIDLSGIFNTVGRLFGGLL